MQVRKTQSSSARGIDLVARFPLCLLLICLAAVSLTAQPALKFADSTAPLNGPWMFHPGDNPAWAQPGFDDSHWTPMDLTVNGGKSAIQGSADFAPGWTDRGFPNLTGYAWYRLSARVDPAQNLSLLMPDSVDDSYELYVNGQLTGQFGNVTPGHQVSYNSRAMLFAMPRPGADGMLHFAIRMYMLPSTPLSNPDSGGLHAPPILGLRAPLQTILAKSDDGNLRNYIGGPILAVPLTLFGLFCIGLFLLSRDRIAYLWLGIGSLINAFGHVYLTLYALTLLLPTPPFSAVLFGLRALMSLIWLLFWVWWFGLENKRFLWLSGVLITAIDIVSICMLNPLSSEWAPPLSSVPMLNLAGVVTRFVIAALLVTTAILGIRKNHREGWLALPSLLILGVALFDLELLNLRIPSVFFPFGIQLTLTSIANLTSFLVTGVLLIRRFIKEQKSLAMLQIEVGNAQQVQQVLVPHDLPDLGNYSVDAVYLPAQTVGGDFFQVIPSADGSLLVVIGDVSGKGIPAAMVVALVVGTLRTAAQFTDSPARLLEMLNERLSGRIKSGFATCLVARISAEGELVAANAGHLHPYLNGRELVLDPQVPLGILEKSTYCEDRWQLEPGDRLTFISDGVVEARGQHGELFGFDRTRDISEQVAQTIADTAKAFGQEDDITVLTVRFGAEQTAAVPA